MRTPGLASLGWLTLLAPLAAGCGGSSLPGETTLVCQPACPAGTHCAAEGCVRDGAPLDLSAGSPDRGGGCDPACGGATPLCNPQQQCVACLVDVDCPAGQVCKAVGAATACVAGCSDDGRCAGNGVPLTTRCCGGQCVDTASDSGNCGACGTSCVASNATAACVESACTAGACQPGWGDCNNDPSDGCEANLRVDAANCGACATSCNLANAVAGCASGCYVAGCRFGFDDCNGNAQDGCEASVLSDAKNCGGCGAACGAVPHATVACNNARCTLSGCSLGFLDCNGDPDDGCEVNGGTDAGNCGACGKACPMGLVCRGSQCTCPMCMIPNASSLCVNNVCLLDKCNLGFANCDANDNNGCEVDVTSDKANCGACGVACPMDAPFCVDGACSQGCLMGKEPPKVCDTGNDRAGTQWVICEADCGMAWLSHAKPGGGSFHPLEICNGLGYSSWSGWAGTTGSVCGTNNGNTSCMNPGKPSFVNSPNNPNMGIDQFGPVIGNTVEWQCIK